MQVPKAGVVSVMRDMDNEVDKTVRVSNEICAKLANVGYAKPESRGNLAHHLAEAGFLGEKFALELLPGFLRTSDKDELASTVVDIHEDLQELKDAIVDMEKDLVQLMNFLNS